VCVTEGQTGLTQAIERPRRAFSAGADLRCRGLSTRDGFAIIHFPPLSWFIKQQSHHGAAEAEEATLTR
jgi:hypothetical protein